MSCTKSSGFRVKKLHMHENRGDDYIPVIPSLFSSSVTGAVLAGGLSSRMGRDKALIEIDGVKIIESCFSVLSTLFENLLLVTNSPERYSFLPYPACPDIFPGEGSLAGIHSAIYHAKTDLVFVAACDMPYLSRDVISHLCSLADGYNIVVPESPNGAEPLHAIYRRDCLPLMESMLLGGKKRIRDIFAFLNIRRVNWEEISGIPGAVETFLNFNTPEELKRIITP